MLLYLEQNSAKEDDQQRIIVPALTKKKDINFIRFIIHHPILDARKSKKCNIGKHGCSIPKLS
jgi:DNA-directed RNA polymerase subunit L